MSSNDLQIAHIQLGVEKVDREIIEGMSGIQTALKCRWNTVNRSMLGGFRFDNNYLIAGLSGHGKSWVINMLQEDFVNVDLNGEYPRPYRLLHFGFEMSMQDEILRKISSKTGISYESLISANQRLSELEYELVKKTYAEIKKSSIYIVENPGTLQQVYNTIEKFNGRFPTDQLVISLDHTLLLNNTYGDEIKLLAETGKMFMLIKKRFGAMGILLGQLNTNIEKDERQSTVQNKKFLHFPKKSDIHGSAQIYHAADFVIVINQPSMLGIDLYGLGNHPTKDLIAWHLIKARKGTPKYIRLKQNLNRGEINEWN